MSELAEREILFVLGSARSGTGFLNSLLDRWFDYGMGPEGTFVEQFHRRLGQYGDLTAERNLSRMVEDISKCQMLEIMRHRYRDEARLDITAEEIRARVLEPSYAGVVYAVFQCLADLRSKTRVGNKNPGYWTHLGLLDELFPGNARYIAILRDGRDVFLSLQEMAWGGHSAYAAARRWCRAITAIEAFQERSGPERLLLLRYEDLLSSPAEIFTRIEAFLDIALTPEKRAAALAEAESNPRKDNFNKWPHRLSAGDRQIYEALAGDLLARHGYAVLPERPKLSAARKGYFEMIELRRLLRVNLYHLRNRLPAATERKAPRPSSRR